MTDDSLMQALRRRLVEQGDCLVWTGSLHAGLPSLSFVRNGRSRRVMTRRVLWECEHGGLPKGVSLVPQCGVVLCCAPSHMAVTRHVPKWKKHGEAHKTPEWKIWVGIRKRCLNPKDLLYKWYGGRGISICPAWQESYSAFLDAVGRRPGSEFSLDRIDNERGYEPGNVRWATDIEQARNKRNTRRETLHGETRPLVEWAEIYGVSYKLVHARMQKGKSLEQALRAPLGKGNSRVIHS